MAVKSLRRVFANPMVPGLDLKLAHEHNPVVTHVVQALRPRRAGHVVAVAVHRAVSPSLRRVLLAPQGLKGTCV